MKHRLVKQLKEQLRAVKKENRELKEGGYMCAFCSRVYGRTPKQPQLTQLKRNNYTGELSELQKETAENIKKENE